MRVYFIKENYIVGAISIETKTCEICGIEFEPTTTTQKYCPECGKNPERTRQKYDSAVRQNKIHAGDLYKPVEIECIVCGKTFMTTYENRRFCSNTCRREYVVNTATCPVCNIKLIEKGVLTGRGYCSEECREKARIQKAILDERYIACEHCGKKFIRPNECSRFCSKACYEAHRMEHRPTPARQDEPLPFRIRPETERTCPVCGKVFPITPQQSSKRFCSIDCRKRASPPKKKTEKRQSGHLCSSCRITQANCERFSSNFKRLPKGARTSVEKGQTIVSECPKYKE